MGRRFLQRLEKSIEGLLGEHVDFVNDIHLRAPSGRSVEDVLSKRTDLINPAITGPVNLDDIHRPARLDFETRGAGRARLDPGPILAI
jgi:hypothetical protein